ncbi:MAG: DUF4169 family protein [Pseudomonadota bacterium]
MADIVNFRRARKAKARTDKAVKAAENRVRHGRTKAEKRLQTSEKARSLHSTDGGKLDTPDG